MIFLKMINLTQNKIRSLSTIENLQRKYELFCKNGEIFLQAQYS